MLTHQTTEKLTSPSRNGSGSSSTGSGPPGATGALPVC